MLEAILLQLKMQCVLDVTNSLKQERQRARKDKCLQISNHFLAFDRIYNKFTVCNTDTSQCSKKFTCLPVLISQIKIS